MSSGIPQGSVLGPILLIMFINYLPSTDDSQMKLFADDIKLYRTVDTKTDAELLQKDIDAVTQWSKMWQLPFNESKCKVVHYGKKNPKYEYRMSILTQMSPQSHLEMKKGTWGSISTRPDLQ